MRHPSPLGHHELMATKEKVQKDELARLKATLLETVQEALERLSKDEPRKVAA